MEAGWLHQEPHFLFASISCFQDHAAPAFAASQARGKLLTLAGAFLSAGRWAPAAGAQDQPRLCQNLAKVA